MIGAIASLLLAIAPAYAVFPGWIVVSASVDASVRVDGKTVLAFGKEARIRVRPGSYLVEVRRDGYEPVASTIAVSRGRTATLSATLVPVPEALAELPIETIPPGASVWIDAKQQPGGTPLIARAPLGDHELKISLAGFNDIVTAITIDERGRNQPVQAALVPNRGLIVVESSPSGAHVYVGGTLRGRTPVKLTSLELGRAVKVTVVLAGYRAETRTLIPGGSSSPTVVKVPMVRLP